MDKKIGINDDINNNIGCLSYINNYKCNMDKEIGINGR
jgi:hypothetical protein